MHAGGERRERGHERNGGGEDKERGDRGGRKEGRRKEGVGSQREVPKKELS